MDNGVQVGKAEGGWQSLHLPAKVETRLRRAAEHSVSVSVGKGKRNSFPNCLGNPKVAGKCGSGICVVVCEWVCTQGCVKE